MAHGALLRQVSDDPELASHIMHDYTTADLDPVTRAMLDYTAKLTRDPHSVTKADFDALKEQGLSDEQMLSVVLITCNFNFMTRLAEGLGVEFPQNRHEGIEGWLTGPARETEWLMKQKV